MALQWLKDLVFPKYEFWEQDHNRLLHRWSRDRTDNLKRRIKKRLKSRDYRNVFRKRYDPALNFWREELPNANT